MRTDSKTDSKERTNSHFVSRFCAAQASNLKRYAHQLKRCFGFTRDAHAVLVSTGTQTGILHSVIVLPGDLPLKWRELSFMETRLSCCVNFFVRQQLWNSFDQDQNKKVMKPNGWQQTQRWRVKRWFMKQRWDVLLFLCYIPAFAGLPLLVCCFLLSFAFLMETL